MRKNESEPNQDQLVAIFDLGLLKCLACELKGLSLEELNAIIQFTFLWMIFEGKVLKRRANVQTIQAVSRKWKKDKLIGRDTFSCELAYFKKRYADNGNVESNWRFNGHLFPPDIPAGTEKDQVKRVLICEDEKPKQIVSAVLIIVYRYRNNLFHGNKWVDNMLKNQLENFTHANNVLEQAIKLHKQTCPDCEE